MPLTVGLFLVFTAFLLGFALANRLIYRKAYNEGYARARTIPIGHLRELAKNVEGVTGIIELDEDVILTPDPSPTGLSIGFHHTEKKP